MKVTDQLDFGSVQVHKRVFADIIFSAIDEIEGVRLIEKGFVQRFLEYFGKTTYPGIDVEVSEDGGVSLLVKILVTYGVNIPDVARQVQDTIKLAVNRVINVNVKAINVNILGIERGEK